MASEREESAETVTSYRDYEKEAHELVTKLIQSSLERLVREQSEQKLRSTKVDHNPPPVKWPTGDNFTVDKGLEAIDTLVKV